MSDTSHSQPPFRWAGGTIPADAVPLLVPVGSGVVFASARGASDWMRAPACPNNATDCRITVSLEPAASPIPPPSYDGSGNPKPPLVANAKQQGTCSVCKLTWYITRGPLGPNDLPLTPTSPPVITPPTPPTRA